MSKGSKTSRIAVWGILLLLIAGLAGFGANSIGNNITSIGHVGKTPITINQYTRALRQEVARETQRRGTAFTIRDAFQSGLDIRVRTGLATIAALTEESRIMGLSVGNEQVAQQIQQIPAFQDPTGEFDREAYRFAIEQSGIRPKEFEADLRATAANAILQQAVTGGITPNPLYAQTLHRFIAQTRDFKWARLTPDMLETSTPKPTDKQLKAFYDENADEFRTPEMRKLSYVWLTPEMLVSTIQPNEDELKALYEERADQYNRPERRMIERLGFADMEEAKAAKAKLDAGDITFEALVEERGLTLDDVNQGEISRDDLDDEIADTVFAITEPGLSAPVETSIGPAIYRINAVLDASTTSFEDVRDALIQEAAIDQAQRVILDKITEIDDLLAGGATLEDLGKETELEFDQIEFSASQTDGIAGYDNFREEAFQLKEGDFPEIRELSDGGIFAVRLDEIIPPALPELNTIKTDIAKAWEKAETQKRLIALAKDYQQKIEKGSSMEDLGLDPQTEEGFLRSDYLDTAPALLSLKAFQMDANETEIIDTPEDVILVKLLKITAPDQQSDESQALLGQISAQGRQLLATDVFELFGRAVETKHGLKLDKAAIDAVHAQLQ